MNLKKFLKTLKLNESSISMILGALVIVVVGILVVNYLRDNKGLLPWNGGQEVNQTEQQTHTVAKGESLWLIAESTYGDGFAWSDIAEANNLENPNLIEEGQNLLLPERETESEAQSIQGTTYTVVEGDHLWGIAVRAYGDGYKWVEIARANSLKNPDLIFVDTVFTLPR